MGRSTPTTAFDGTIWYFAIQCWHIEHTHEGVWLRKNVFLTDDSCENLDNFTLIRLLYMHRWCLHGPINSYHSFWWSNLTLRLYNIDRLNICMKESGWIFLFWQNDSYENFDNFPLYGFVYAWIVPSWADQLLTQLLMEQFDMLPIQCRHIEHMHKRFGSKKQILIKWHLWELFFRYKLWYIYFRCEKFCVFDLNKCSRLQALRSFAQILLKSCFQN